MSRVACPVCGYLTFWTEDGFPGSYNVCPICYWEDDPVQFKDPDYAGGANRMSINQAKENFKKYQACEVSLKSKCRLPTQDEIPE